MNQVLVVDDHFDVRQLLHIALGREFEILDADNGVDALNAVLHHNPRVVLLDVMMPGKLDGLQVLDAIKSDRRCMDTYVAVISARGQQADKDEAYRFGADAYFTKPFSPISLVNWVRARFQ
jgi:CheY-like chemotaxis protein